MAGTRRWVAAAVALSSLLLPGAIDDRARASDTTPRPGRGAASVSTGDRLVEQFGPTSGEQTTILGTDVWHEAGFDGSGVTIGVIDFFDIPSYWDVAEHGPVPVAGTTAICLDRGVDCTNEFFDGVDEGGDDHGVAVVEAIRDVAPGSTILIARGSTISDYRSIVDWFVAHDVDIVSRSLGSRFDGPGDGRGPLDDVVADATTRGLLWINSAGNNARDRFYRHPVRLAGDRVAFGPSGTDTFLDLAGCIALAGVRWAGDWDLPATDRTDYDVYLWESPTGDPAAGSIVERATRRQRLGAEPIESLSTSRCPVPGSSFYLEIELIAGNAAGDVLEILDYSGGIAQYTTAAGSAAVPVVDSTSPAVVGVGAIDPSDSATVAVYSSRGPSTDGRVLPDVVAPGNIFSTVTGRFAGTSAAAAVTAGVAALYLDAGVAADAVSLADAIRHLAVDRGTPGPDNSYGHGEVVLPDPPRAATPVPARYVPLDAPVRFLDTRPTSPVGPPSLVGELRRGEILELPIGGVGDVPTSGVTAVAINLVSTGNDRPSYVQAFPTGGATLAGFSNLNVDAPGQTRANFAIVPVGADGTISLYTVADGHLVVDVLGWFEVAPVAVAAGRFVALDESERLLDTRTTAAGALRTGDVREVPAPAGTPSAGVAALVVTVTAAAPTEHGWLQAFPSTHPDVVAKTSTVNTAPGTNVANVAIVPVADGPFAVTGRFANDGSSHVVVDAIGYITGPAAEPDVSGRYVAVTPGRAFDSRTSTGPLPDGVPVPIDAASGAAVPPEATGVVWNAAIVGAHRPGHAQAWPPGSARPETSVLNWSYSGEIRAAAVISATAGSRTLFAVDDGVLDAPAPVGDLVVDVFGYFT